MSIVRSFKLFIKYNYRDSQLMRQFWGKNEIFFIKRQGSYPRVLDHRHKQYRLVFLSYMCA